MASRVWRIEEPSPHVVRVEHGYWSGRVKIWLDGELIYQRDFTLVDYGLDYGFEVDGGEVEVRITCHLLCYYRYHLWLDGEVVEPARDRRLR